MVTCTLLYGNFQIHLSLLLSPSSLILFIHFFRLTRLLLSHLSSSEFYSLLFSLTSMYSIKILAVKIHKITFCNSREYQLYRMRSPITLSLPLLGVCRERFSKNVQNFQERQISTRKSKLFFVLASVNACDIILKSSINKMKSALDRLTRKIL